MSVKRDYGNFSKAVAKRLEPRVEGFGYHKIKGGAFGRQKAGWVEGFFLQQSQRGAGRFRVNIGIHFPKLHEYWQSGESFGLIVSAVLAPEGIAQGDRWFPAENAAELDASIEQVIIGLHNTESWFSGFRSLSDVADLYYAKTPNMCLGQNNCSELGAANYGFLLAESGEREKAIPWLREAERLFTLPLYVGPHGTRVEPSTPGAKLIERSAIERDQLKAIQNALRKLQP